MIQIALFQKKKKIQIFLSQEHLTWIFSEDSRPGIGKCKLLKQIQDNSYEKASSPKGNLWWYKQTEFYWPIALR